MAFLYNILPEYTRTTDTLTDRNITGEVKVLEEYLNIVDKEVFDIISNSIREILDFRDVYKMKSEYLPYFAYLLGYCWNSYVDDSVQRQIVAGILQLYKRKGTKFSFHFTLYSLDPNIEIYEPYKDIFILNKSRLGDKNLTSRNYYSYGIIVLKIENYSEQIFELFDLVKPAGWKVIVEGRYGLFYNIHIKPESEIRTWYLSDKYIITDPTDEEQVQYWHSVQYVNGQLYPITMVGHTLFVDSLWTVNDLQYMTTLYPDENELLLWRLPCQFFGYTTETP